MDGQTQTKNIFMSTQASNPGFAPTPLDGDHVEHEERISLFAPEDDGKQPITLAGTRLKNVEKMSPGNIQADLSAILSNPNVGRIKQKANIHQMSQVAALNSMVNENDGSVKDIETGGHAIMAAIDAVVGHSLIGAAVSAMAQDSAESEGQDKGKKAKADQSND